MIISCVVLNYNDADTTSYLVNRIKEYSLINYIIIVDNNSSDDSYQRLMELKGEKIIVIKAKKNGGYGYGNNLGIRYSSNKLKSDFTLIVNPDVEFEETIIMPLVQKLKDDQQIAISTCVQKNRHEKLTPAWKKTSSLQDVLSASLVLNKLLKKRYYELDFYKNKDYVYVYQVPGSLLMVDTELMIEYGMYDEDIFLYEEEKILATKMEKYNLKSVLLLDYEYIHNHNISINKTFKSNVVTKKILLESKYKYLKKYRGLNTFQLFFSKIFFKITILEMSIYSFLKK